MNRGVLLSEGIRSRVWPWAPFHPSRPLSAPGLSDPVWQFAPWAEFAHTVAAAALALALLARRS